MAGPADHRRYPIALVESTDSVADRLDLSGGLMAEDQKRFTRRRETEVKQSQFAIRTANTNFPDAESHLALRKIGRRFNLADSG
jgi:hypothetical protein